MTEADPAPLQRTTVVVGNGDLLASELSDSETVMLDIDQGAYFGVEGVAKTIWDFIDAPRTLADIYAKVASEYDVSSADVESDVVAFVRELLDAGLATIDS